MMDRKSEAETELSPVKRALFEIRELRAKLKESEDLMKEPIAIIGMGLRFPGGANDPDSFWRLLCDGEDAITEVPADRWDVNEYYDPDPDAPGKMSTRCGGFLKEVDKFDPEFFGISPREAMTMDPQQRLLLEVVWESLENGGQAPNELFGSLTGVFIGIASFDYLQDQMQKIGRKHIDTYFTTGSIHSVASGRISYVLGLRGPSISLDTACSSSLVAIHLACQSLRTRECNLALAGGVNLILRPEFHINFSKTHVLAADGRCKAFDASADGFVRSEGCGIVVLKRLSDAIHDSDNILAIIRGTATNQDGRSSGLTAPNGPSQQEVIRKALVNGGVNAFEVQYVEAHGTGTELGDPIEVQALAAVYGEGRSPSTPLLIGSVKTNIGHLETAAGVAGLIKLVLAFKHGKIPPHLHLKQPNPHIPWNDIPIRVPKEGCAWPNSQGRRIGGVSSFGFSGTNSHIVVEEAPRREPVLGKNERPLHLLTLSAKSERGLQDHVSRLAGRMSGSGSLVLGDIAYTANACRSHFARRLALIAATTREAEEKLKTVAQGGQPVGVCRSDVISSGIPEVVFLFTGQGAQYVAMGRKLYDTQPTFRRALEECGEYLRTYMEPSLLQLLYPEDNDIHLLHQTANTQPALFALEYAISQLWRSWGVEPSAVIGHGVGEYVAACLAGIFTLEEGLRIVAERGRMMQELSAKGMMVEVFAAEEQVRAAIQPHDTTVSIAAINSPRNIVISGENRAVRTVVAELEQKGINTRQLNVSHAFHSFLMEPMLDDFAACARQIRFQAPGIPLISNLTGTVFNHAESGNYEYWRRHARETTRFADGMRTLYERGYRLFLEIGPHPTLCGLGQDCISDDTVLWLPSLKLGCDDWQQMLESLAQLYVRGAKVNWHGFDRDYVRCKVSLPTYPFQREHYWFDDDEADRQIHWWEGAAAAGLRQSIQIPMDLGLHTYEAKWRSLHSLTTAYIVSTLHQLGVFNRPAETYTEEELLDRCGIATTHHRLVLRWLERLSNEGLLLRQGERLINTEALSDPQLNSMLQNARKTLHDTGFLVDYIERCGTMLCSILTGRESPLETLFPGGSYQTAENIYQHWALSRYFNGIVAALVGAYVNRLAPDRKVRVLEVGAGTGGTTSAVLPVLPVDRTLYLYSDLSEMFFHQARRKFSNYPFVRYCALDIERNPSEQGYQPHSVDIVIAANVLHATRNLADTVQNVLSLLAPEGLLLLYEVTEPHSWFDISVALIEGWQVFEDGLRKNGPLLNVEQWQTLLRAQGFTEVMAFPETGSPTEILKAHVFMARAPRSSKSYVSDPPVVSNELLGNFISPSAMTDETYMAEEQQDGMAFIRQLEEATPDECHELLVDYVGSHVNKVLRRDPSKGVNRHLRLMDLGVDSLMAIELRNSLGIGLGLTRALPATLIFDYPTIENIARYLVTVTLTRDGRKSDKASVPFKDPSDPRRVCIDSVEGLSEQEVEILILEKLKSLEKDK